MECIIFTGLQASGKSTFYLEKFYRTHVRINLDMLKTRHREHILFDACLEAKQRMVIDNTNPTVADRKKYIEKAKRKKVRVIGYFFESDFKACLARNDQRSGKAKIPAVGLKSLCKKLTQPSFEEGFHKIFKVCIRNDKFIVEEVIE